MSYSPEVRRLITEFNGQDLAVDIIVLNKGRRITAAVWSDGNQSWELTKEGRELLNPPEEPVDDVPVGKPKAVAGPASKGLDIRKR